MHWGETEEGNNKEKLRQKPKGGGGGEGQAEGFCGQLSAVMCNVRQENTHEDAERESAGHVSKGQRQS